jgi:hypothetical protein
MASFVALLAILTCPLVQGQKQEQAASARIATLVQQLDDDDYHVRESAYQQLKEIGMPALEAVKAAGQGAGPDLEKRVARLVKAIEYRHHANEAVMVNGAEFLAQADRIWKMPDEGKALPISLTLKITNRSGKPVFFYLRELTFSLADDEGRYFANTTWAEHSFMPKQLKSPPLQPGQSFEVKVISAKLTHPKNRPVACLEAEGNMREPYCFEGFGIGRYYVQLALTCRFNLQLPDGTASWIGSAGTYPLAIEIK